MNPNAKIDPADPENRDAELARLRREIDRIADAVALEIRSMETVAECVERLVRERR